jgi:hypothetical protein
VLDGVAALEPFITYKEIVTEPAEEGAVYRTATVVAAELVAPVNAEAVAPEEKVDVKPEFVA